MPIDTSRGVFDTFFLGGWWGKFCLAVLTQTVGLALDVDGDGALLFGVLPCSCRAMLVLRIHRFLSRNSIEPKVVP